MIRTVAFAPPLSDAEGPLREALEVDPQLVVGVGSFRDDVKLARKRALLGRGRVLAFVGAGLEAFHRAVGDDADGVIGPSQWEPGIGDPPRTGPDAEWFRAAYARRFGSRPGYPAAQAFAIGVILEECVRKAQSLDDRALLDAARALETTTLYGGFRLDPATARQIGHRVLLVQWRAGRRKVLRGGAPPGVE